MTRLLLKLFHLYPCDPQNARARSAVGKLSGGVGIVCNVLLFAAKLFVGLVSGSVSVTADALNNLSDATGSVVTLVGFKLSEKPADEDHPYGHARYEYLSGLGVAALILLIGFELAKSSVQKIIAPTPVELSVPMTLILVGSVCIKLWMFLFNRYLGRKIESTALTAVAADSRNDAVATTAVLIAALLERFLQWRVDGIMGLGVAAFILYSGIMLAKETISSLLGEDVSPQLRKGILETLAEEERVLGYHDLMVHDYGPGKRFASAHVEMDRDEDPLLCHEIIDNLERECLNRHGVHLVIHYDPVVTNDPELERLRKLVTVLLQAQDSRITIHDFRMVQGQGHTNLIFDAALPAEIMEQKKTVKSRLDQALAQIEPGKYYTVINFDLQSFNTD